MNKKQTRTLIRIIAAAVITVALAVLDRMGLLPQSLLRLALYAVPYLLVGYDILLRRCGYEERL